MTEFLYVQIYVQSAGSVNRPANLGKQSLNSCPAILRPGGAAFVRFPAVVSRNPGAFGRSGEFMRIVRAFVALACLMAVAGCSSPGQFQLTGLNWGQDPPPPPPGSGELTSSPASATSDITGSTPVVAGANPVAVHDEL